MKLLKVFALSFLFLNIHHGYSQINLSELTQPSTLAQSDDNALYFIDFWATWCAPCIHVAKYLEVLQKQVPNDLYILSLTQENPMKIHKFMKTHKLNLAVGIDNDGDTFFKNKIQTLPYGILFNALGEKLWEGHPADLTLKKVKEFLLTQKKRKKIDAFFNIESYKTDENKSFTKLTNAVEITELLEPVNFEAKKEFAYNSVKGPLTSIMAYLYQFNPMQIELKKDLNTNYEIKYAKTLPLDSLRINVLNNLNLKTEMESKTGDVYQLNIEQPTFWDTQQYQWDDDAPTYSIEKMSFKADNVNVNAIAYTLSNLLNKPVIFKNEISDTAPHDWEIHYKFFELMQSNLMDNYGIEIIETKASYPILKVLKN